MDKAAPKADPFKANLDRAAPLLAKLKEGGIGHMIDGQIVPSISGATFETRSPVDGTVLAKVARGNAEDIDHADRLGHFGERGVTPLAVDRAAGRVGVDRDRPVPVAL